MQWSIVTFKLKIIIYVLSWPIQPSGGSRLPNVQKIIFYRRYSFILKCRYLHSYFILESTKPNWFNLRIKRQLRLWRPRKIAHFHPISLITVIGRKRLFSMSSRWSFHNLRTPWELLCYFPINYLYM